MPVCARGLDRTAAAGLRQGELFGLEWADVDLEGKALSVRRTLVELAGKFTTGEPKSAKGRRLVQLPEFAVAALWRHKARMLAEGLAGDQRVFSDEDGQPLRRDRIRSHSLHPLLKRAGLPMIRFHDLRHTAATLLLSEGVHPKIVQERLGHSTIGLTLDTYSHVLPNMQHEAAGKLDRLLG